MRLTFLAIAGAALLVFAGAPARAASLYDYSLEDIDGKPVSFDQFRGKVVLVVNTATRCGYAYQFDNRYLTEKTTDPRFAGPISWNFNKFLIGRDGSILARFRTQDEPQNTTVRTALEAALGS
jgi:glutathione peroxidase-family protein